MVRGEKLMVSFSVAHDYISDGLVVENPDYIVPFPLADQEPTPRGGESVASRCRTRRASSVFLLASFRRRLADVELI